MSDHEDFIQRAAFGVLARWTDEQGRDWHGDLTHGGLTPVGVAWDVFGTRAPSGDQIDAVDRALSRLEREGAAIRVPTGERSQPAPALYLAPSTTEEGIAFCEERVAHYERAAELWRDTAIEGAAAAAERAERAASHWREQVERWRDAEAARRELTGVDRLSTVA